jgi:PAS domain S-box-containing protein
VSSEKGQTGRRGAEGRSPGKAAPVPDDTPESQHSPRDPGKRLPASPADTVPDCPVVFEDIEQAAEWAQTIILTLHEPLVLLDGELRLVSANRSFYDLFGKTPGKTKGESFFRLGDGQWDVPELKEKLGGILTDGASFENFELKLKQPGYAGSFILLNARVLHVSEGKPALVLLAIKDATEREQREERLRRLNRVLRALSDSDQAMMRATSEPDYLNEVCRVIIEDCGYSMVWIGFAENDENKTVRPVTQAGFEEGYLETVNITWADTKRGRGPTGTAIRTGKPAICRNMLTDPDFKPWRKEALKRGYASSIVLPLISDGKAFGAINIYSKLPDPFSEEEIELLTELGNDLTYGLKILRLRQEQRQAEAAVREARDQLEVRVKERTAELEEANRRLKEENEERLRSEQSLRVEQARLDALYRLSRISEAPVAEMAAFALDQGIALTQSKIGFLGFLSEDEAVYTLHAVSKDVVKECDVSGNPMQWHVMGAGVWAEAIRQRKTLFMNDYSQPHPAKKGFPPGHPPVAKFMVVPVLEGGKIVALAGMGNKSTDYDKSDERQVALLLAGMWNYVQRNRSREALQEAYDELEIRVKQRTAELQASSAALQKEVIERRQMEESLRQSEQRFRTLYSSMTEGMALHEVIYDNTGVAADYRILEVNPAFEEITGISASSALGKKASELYGMGSPPYLDIYAKVASGSRPEYFETYFAPMKKHFAISVFSPGKGKFATVFTDISERKRAEAELHAASERLELAQKSAGAGIWDWDMSTGKLDWSPELFRLFGLDPETSEASFEVWRGVVHPKDVKDASERIDKAVKNHIPLASEYRIILPSGQIRWVNSLGSAAYDDQGRAVRMSGISIDVTERKQAEQAIRDKEEELNAIYESAPLIMLLVDGERKVRKANKSAQDFGGASSSDLLGLRAGQVLKCVYSSDDPKGCGFGPNCEECTIRRLVDSTLQTGRSYTDVEAGLSLIATAGEKVRDQTFLLSTSRLNIRGEPLVLITLQDITARKQAEDLLRVSEERQRSQAASLQALLDAAPMVIWIAQDRECRNIYGNRFAQELLRVPEGTNMSKSGPQPESVAHFRVLKDGKELAPEEMPIQRVAGSGRGLTDATIDIVFDDGTVRTLLGNVAPLFDSQGTPNGAIASFVDVTERNRAQNALRKSERDLERAQAVAHIGSWKLDLQQNALLWSDETHRIFGIPKGQPMTYETFLSSVHPDDREFVEQAWKAALRGERYDIEHRIVVGNGVKWVREQAEFDFDKEGILRAAFGTVRDITRRKLAELELEKLTAELRKERDILEIIKEHANAHLAYLDPDFNFVRVNSMYARGVGYEPDQLIGRNYFDLFPDEQNRAIFRKVKNMGEPIEFRAKPMVSRDRPEGGVTYWDWALTPVKDDSGGVVGLELSMIDITDIKRAEEEIMALNESLGAKAAELAASNKELEAFSYSVSHDLRAPLRNIDGFSQALLEDYASQLDGKGKDFLKRVRAATQRMGRLIDDLLSLSVTMRKEMRREKVDLSELAVGITRELKERQPKRQVEVMIQQGALVSGDPRLLEEMLANLLRNAWKFTSKCPTARIEFGHAEKNGEKLFFVKDNGAGFDMKYADKLFIPFQRLHSLSEFSGNGIGLAIVKRIIDRHGGSVWAEGETDKGAIFYFKLQPIGEVRRDEGESHSAG